MAVLALPSAELDALTGNDLLKIAGDVTSHESRGLVVDRTIQRLGRIDALVNSAGVGLYAPPSTLPLDLLSRVIDINVVGSLAMSQLVIPWMRERGSGVIVNMGSVSASVAMPWAAGYCASKAALDSLHESLRRELKGDCIHLVKACLGIVSTGFREHVLTGRAPEGVARIRRMVPPEIVAEKIYRAIERRRQIVYVPAIARLFTLMQSLTPGLMDWYLGKYYQRDSESPERLKKFASGR